MKTVKMEVPVEIARRLLSGIEGQISEKIRSRDAMNTEISELEASANALRVQLKNGSANGERPRGDNRERIREYLGKLPDNKGARASEISKATGIGTSSTAFTLDNYEADFIRDDVTKIWKLRI